MNLNKELNMGTDLQKNINHQEKFWFNRMVEHWSIPQRLNLVEQVRRAGLQVVQAGTFGPMFYGLADDPEVSRSWVGMPLLGVRENLAYAAELIPRLKEAGARVVGQMSMSWNYGDQEKGRGLFEGWEQLWTDNILGPMPCADVSLGLQRFADGSLRHWPIAGRPYLTYTGCMCNPHWLAVLKPMVRKAIDLGVDGFNVHHNFENFCHCCYCQDYVWRRLQEEFTTEELQNIFGAQNLTEIEIRRHAPRQDNASTDAFPKDVLSPQPECPAELRQRFEMTIKRATNLRRKEAFDEVFVKYGRSLKPELLLAQWYHKYDFKPNDERSLLPGALWAKDEDYIWYSQGGHKGESFIEHGYLADMGLPARFIYAASGGKPFVINKYDSRRWRLSIAEAAANHGAALAFHWGHEGDSNFALEDYYAPVIRYHRFLADNDSLVHPACPWSQIALVYPRRAELESEMDCLETLKRLGRLLEDEHLLFDIILDEQLLERADDYAALILPEVRRLSPKEADQLRRFVEKGGKLVFTGDTGKYRLDGRPYADNPLSDWQTPPAEGEYAGHTEFGKGAVLYIPEGPWESTLVEVKEGVRLPLYPSLEEDTFGQAFLTELNDLLEGSFLKTNAPWFVRVRAWWLTQREALVLHWVNYRQDEDTGIEVPFPVGPLEVECAVPPGYEVEKIEWLYPEMRQAAVLPHENNNSHIRFTIPTLIVYGLSVLYLKKEKAGK